MKDLVKRISESSFKSWHPTASLIGSSFSFENESQLNESSTITFHNGRFTIFPPKIKSAIAKIESFSELPKNWDSYGANPPSRLAVKYSIEFLSRMSNRQRDPSLIIPTPDEGIVIEFQEENVRLEFLFLSDGSEEVSGFLDNEMKFDHPLNDTTEEYSLKWLFCPNGNCDSWE